MCWFIRYEFICFSQNHLSAWTEQPGLSVNCAPNTISEFTGGAQAFFIFQFVSPVCLCFFNLLPTGVAFWVRIPVKTFGMSSGCWRKCPAQAVWWPDQRLGFQLCYANTGQWKWDELPGDGCCGAAGPFSHHCFLSLSGYNGEFPAWDLGLRPSHSAC